MSTDHNDTSCPIPPYGHARVSIEHNQAYQSALVIGNNKNESEEEPYKLQYASRNILNGVRVDQVSKHEFDSDQSSINTTDYKLSISLIDFKLGLSFIETQEISSGETLLKSAIHTLSQRPDLFHFELIEANNQLGVIGGEREQYEQAKQYLQKSLDLYTTWKSVYSECRAQHEGDTRAGHVEFESLHTHTLYYLAQIYANTNEIEQAAKFCYQTLDRQLAGFHCLDKKDWTLNCMKLSAFYLHNNNFRQAMYCIDAASHMCPAESCEDLDMLRADVHVAYGQVYAKHLRISHDIMIRQANTDQKKNLPSPHELFEQLCCSALDTFSALKIAEPSPVSLIDNLKMGVSIYDLGVKHINAAMLVYKLDGFVSDHVAQRQTMSGMMRDLCVLAIDPSYICKMHKRRITLLEPLLTELNPKVYVHFSRQIANEVGEAYAAMTDKKSQLVHTSSGAEKIARIKKINFLATKAIRCFRVFIASFNNGSNNDIESIYTIIYLNAHFQMARMYSKMIAVDAKAQADFLKLSLTQYEKIVSIAESQKDLHEFSEELSICKQMCSLLPLKIQRCLNSQ